MKKLLSTALVLSSLIVLPGSGRAQNIFVDLRTDAALPATSTINAPAGYSYSAAAPVAGTTWNTVGRSTTVPQNTTPGTDFTLYSGLPLVDSLGLATSAMLSVVYHSTVTTGTRTEPSTGNGENVIQPGGPTQNAWRNFLNGSGGINNYLTFTLNGLGNNAAVDFYILGGTTTANQGVTVSNITGTATSGLTLNNVQNSNLSYGSLWTDANADLSFELMAQGTTWDRISGQSDGAGTFSFQLRGPQQFLSGFQIVTAVPEPVPGMILPGGALLLAIKRFRGNRPAK